jgi:HD-GYP domain-containing protein (c-di-GMP phosphodiesterase class II)
VFVHRQARDRALPAGDAPAVQAARSRADIDGCGARVRVRLAPIPMSSPAHIAYEQSPAAQRQLEQARRRRVRPLDGRERLVELVVGGGFAVAAAALAVLGGGTSGFDWSSAAMAVLVLAAASMVTFEVGATYTMPVELVFIPMLFVLPPAVVPLCVAIALTLPKLCAGVAGRRPLDRAFMAFGDSWFAMGPALVLVAAGPGGPSGQRWPVYVAALAAQFAVDFAASSGRDALNGGASFRDQLRESTWVYLVDMLLAAPGLAVAFAAVERPWIVLLTLPLIGLMLMFARERRARVDHALELGRAYRGTALVLGNVVEADDAYTGSHSEGVVELAVRVADELGLDGVRRRNVEFAALLHDVGKLAVPKEIINKPGPLDDDEWAVMRQHTIEGQRLLDQVGGFMREIGLVVRSSHERVDGGGYPDGLAGDEIPLEARIVSCCDAFNAMTTDRSYRRARPADAAVRELRDCAGSQFDPAVVDAVVAVVERRRAIEIGAAALLPDAGAALERASGAAVTA